MSAELPLGFGMALAQNEAAMHRFESLNEGGKAGRPASSPQCPLKEDMRDLVSGLLNAGKHT